MSLEARYPPPTDGLEQIKQYHQQTKHDFNHYARSLGYMDWANQPNPFRRYEGAHLFQLPLLTPDDDPMSPSYESLYEPSAIHAQALTLNTLSRFFELALSITAWKEYGGNRWALRSNPSSGNLHPTEGYLFLGHVPNLSLTPGLYHYTPQVHGLEQRLDCPNKVTHRALADFPDDAFLVGLSSIHWREAWKYGERAFRYCQHDIGHAIGTLRIAAATLGWNLVILSGMADHTIGTFLGLSRIQDFENVEAEFPEIIAAVWPRGSSHLNALPLFLLHSFVQELEQQAWQGKANRLSRDSPIQWEIIDTVTKSSWKSQAEHTMIPWGVTKICPLLSLRSIERSSTSSPTAHQIIHQRRSALSLDGKTSIHVTSFCAMLFRTIPQADLPVDQRPMPWDSFPWDPSIHLVLFVHRVDGIPPGMYMLLRHNSLSILKDFQDSMHSQFVWTMPEGWSSSLPLYLLEEGNAQKIAMQLSCWQEIAGDGAFSLGMIADFDHALERWGPWYYKRLFWEAGLIGQVLYLEAESAGVRSTGIGCFFDNPVHQVLGFPDTRFQSLYHFTIGGAIEDSRLTTLPPYGEHVP